VRRSNADAAKRLAAGDLKEAFGDIKLDFSNSFKISHAVYILERFSEGMLSNHCIFHTDRAKIVAFGKIDGK